MKVTADTLSLSLETVLAESLALFFPGFEHDMPVETQADLTALSLLSDAQLWPVAHQRMAEERQLFLEELTERRKHRELTPEEQRLFERLVQEARHIMLVKAEAYRILSQRGHHVFDQGEIR